jgi:hypothetical protein
MSYRAAPPRGCVWACLWAAAGAAGEACAGELCGRGGWAAGSPGLAATCSSAPCGAVPWALGVFTAEFGMGSGALPPAMATRPGEPAGSGVGGGTGAGPGLDMPAAGLAGLAATRGGMPPEHGPAGAGPGWGSAFERLVPVGSNGLPRFHLRPIDVVVFHGSRRDLVLRGASRLDAFSGYPVRT